MATKGSSKIKETSVSPKFVLLLPAPDHAKSAVLNSLTCQMPSADIGTRLMSSSTGIAPRHVFPSNRPRAGTLLAYEAAYCGLLS